ncbi:MAG: hypothetical protein ACKV2T_03270 [Kofleriaceae bacterium]
MSTREDWQRRLGPLYGGAVALVHSTPWRWPTEVSDDQRSALWIVVLGVPVGLVAWLVAMLFHAAGVPDVIGALAGLAALTAASAALVERGLAESIDRWTRTRAGAASGASVPTVLVLVFTTMIRAAAILVVPQSMWLWVFVATAVVGRWAAIFLQGLGDPIAHDESARSLVAVPAPAWLTAAISGGVVVLSVLALGKIGIVAMALGAVATFALGLATQRRDGGLSPGVVAAAAAIGEMLVLLVATIR